MRILIIILLSVVCILHSMDDKDQCNSIDLGQNIEEELLDDIYGLGFLQNNFGQQSVNSAQSVIVQKPSLVETNKVTSVSKKRTVKTGMISSKKGNSGEGRHCILCNKTFNSKRLKMKHEKTWHNFCSVCNKGIKRRNMNAHLLFHDVTLENDLKCFECEIGFLYKSGFLGHKERVHNK